MSANNLEKIKKDLFEFIKSEKSLTIFFGRLEETEDGIDLAKRCYWNDISNPKQFLEVAKFLGVKLIYYEEIKEDDFLDTLNQTLAQIGFEFMYNDILHTLVIKSDKLIQIESESSNTENESTEEEKKIEILEEQLCKRCKKEQKFSQDKDFCFKCIEELRTEAEEKNNLFAKVLSEDAKFKGLPNENARTLYVKEKYKEENKNNKFLFLKKLAKDAYALSKMNQ